MDLKPLFTKLTQIKPSETRSVLLSFLFVFILMASYMILKPVRDALPSDWGDVSLAVQWTFTFVISTITVSVYNFFASKIALQKLVPGVFVFFALSFLAIFVLSRTGFNSAILGKVFYVWTSVFALFHISVFWSFTSQAYTKEESKRVFGFINTGASAGAIIGPLLVILLVKNVPLEGVLLITSFSLVAVLPIISLLNKAHRKSGQKHETSKGNLNPNPFSGFKDLVTNKQLLNISLFIFLFAGISSFLYIAQNEALVDYSSSERRELLGSLDLAVNILTVILGVFVTNRLTRKFGLSTALSIVPFFIAATLLLLSLNPAVMFVLALQLLRKSGNYAITRPAREILYTGVSKEARFKSKPIIDVAIYRGADVFWIWSLAFLGDGYLNLSLGEKLWIGAVIAIVWGVLGVQLGKRYDKQEKLQMEDA